jgi:hypothetical protein
MGTCTVVVCACAGAAGAQHAFCLSSMSAKKHTRHLHAHKKLLHFKRMQPVLLTSTCIQKCLHCCAWLQRLAYVT